MKRRILELRFKRHREKEDLEYGTEASRKGFRRLSEVEKKIRKQ